MAIKKSLEVGTSGPVVNNIKHGLVENGSGGDKTDQSDHSQTSVDDFGLFSKSSLHSREVSEGVLFALHAPFVFRVVGVQQKWVSEGKWADGGHKRNTKEVGIGHQDDSTLVGDCIFSRDGGKSSPLLQVKKHIGIRDQSMALGVGTHNDEEPAEHSMTSVPLLGMDTWSPSILGQRRIILGPVLLGFSVLLRRDEVQSTAAK